MRERAEAAREAQKRTEGVKQKKKLESLLLC